MALLNHRKNTLIISLLSKSFGLRILHIAAKWGHFVKKNISTVMNSNSIFKFML